MWIDDMKALCEAAIEDIRLVAKAFAGATAVRRQKRIYADLATLQTTLSLLWDVVKAAAKPVTHEDDYAGGGWRAYQACRLCGTEAPSHSASCPLAALQAHRERGK